MLTHQSPDERALQAVREGGQWLAAQRAEAQRKTDGAVSDAARFLTAGQRAAIELDEPHNRRVAWQTTYGRAQAQAVRMAQTDLEGWAKAATEDAYVNERDIRLDNVLKAAYPNSNFDLQAVKKAVGDYYDAVRKLAAVAYAAERPRFRDRLVTLLPLPVDPQATTPGVCSVSEWTQLLSDPKTYDSLVALLNVLPLGDRP